MASAASRGNSARRGARLSCLDSSELRETSNRLANVLCAQGIGRGDRVAILLPQMPAVAASHIAIYKLGAIALPLAVLFGVEAISYRLKDSGARAVITNAQGLAKLAGLRDSLPDLALVLSVTSLVLPLLSLSSFNAIAVNGVLPEATTITLAADYLSVTLPYAFFFTALVAFTMTEPIHPAANLARAAGYDRPVGDPKQSRSMTIAQHGIVATSQPLAAQVGTYNQNGFSTSIHTFGFRRRASSTNSSEEGNSRLASAMGRGSARSK